MVNKYQQIENLTHVDHKELRVGNLIYGKDQDFNSLLYTNAVAASTILAVRDHPDFFYAIPLTVDWFERLGFTIWKGNIYKGYFFIMENDKGFLIRNLDYPAREIKYVHQLQNLYFALTGEELTVKEFQS